MEQLILKSFLNYSGSKDKIMTQLIEHFPNKESVQTFYDVFTGGLSVTINTNYKSTVSNDILSPLINLYRSLYTACKNSDEENEIIKLLSYKLDRENKDGFIELRKSFNVEKNDPYKFFSLVCSSTNNLMRFNKKFEYNQTFGKRTINDNIIKKLRDYCGVLKQKEIEFQNNHFSNFFMLNQITKDDFVYLDPPYAGTCAGYNSIWSKGDEEYLYKVLNHLNETGVRFALSGVSIHKGLKNPNLERLEKYKIITLEHSYEKVAKIKGLESQEILVVNY